MTSGPHHKIFRFGGRLASALAIGLAIAVLGIGIEHSMFAQVIAPHSYDSVHSQVTFRDGRPYVEETKVVNGRRTTVLHPIPFKKGDNAHPDARIETKGVSPVDVSSWPQVVTVLGQVAGIALIAAAVDRLRRIILRRRRLVIP